MSIKRTMAFAKACGQRGGATKPEFPTMNALSPTSFIAQGTPQAMASPMELEKTFSPCRC
jgi:hypothetical protein